MKIILYSSILFALLILYLGLMIKNAPIASSITASAGLIILGLLFYEIYKKYNFSPRAKYLLIFFVIFWTALVISQIEYIPSKNILVKDIFGKPLENISITLSDDMGQLTEHSTFSRTPKVFYYLTDNQGGVETKPRFYFGQRKAKSTSVVINGDVYKIGSDYTDEDIITKTNLQFDSKSVTLYENKYEIDLSPIKIDYQTCNSISDQKRKSECLVFGLFYSAVKENNYHLCEGYDSEGVNQALSSSHRFNLSRPSELKYECMILVEGLLNNNPKVCNEIEDKDTRYFNQQCKVIFSEWENNPENCGSSYNSSPDKNKCKELRIKVMSNTNNFLCSKDSDLLFGNPFYLQTAAPLYKEMFCQ